MELHPIRDPRVRSSIHKTCDISGPHSAIRKERERQIDRVLANTAGMDGEVGGIVGSTMPPIPALELDTIAGRVEGATADTG
jgi:hypothetical protein